MVSAGARVDNIAALAGCFLLPILVLCDNVSVVLSRDVVVAKVASLVDLAAVE